MAGYTVSSLSGVTIPNASGDPTFYPSGSVVSLSKLLPENYQWMVQNGILSENFSLSEQLLSATSSNSTWTDPTNNNVSQVRVTNDGTGVATAHSNILLRTTATGGSPFISMDVAGVAGWTVGVDNADGEKFKIAQGWNGFPTPAITIDSSRNVNMKTAYAYKTGTSGAWTDTQHKVINLGTVSSISGISHSGGTYTVTYPGIYQVYADLAGPGAAGSCYMDLYINGTQSVNTITGGSMSAFGWWSNLTWTGYLAGSQSVAVWAQQTSGASRTPTEIKTVIVKLSDV